MKVKVHLQIFNTILNLIEIGIIDNLTKTRYSIEVGDFRVFEFDDEILPAMKLLLGRMFNNNPNIIYDKL